MKLVHSIETSRLIIREFTKEDALFAASIWNDPTMGEYLPDESMTEIDPEYLHSLETLGEDEECCYLIVTSKADHSRIGTCSFMPDEASKAHDIAYCVHKDYWRMGYGTEIAQALIDYASSLGMEKITVRVNQDNPGSNGIMKKLEFEVVDTMSYLKRGTAMTYTDYLYEKKLK